VPIKFAGRLMAMKRAVRAKPSERVTAEAFFVSMYSQMSTAIMTDPKM
jgi:hypothetical protein